MSRLGIEVFAPLFGEGPSTSQSCSNGGGPYARAGDYALRFRDIGSQFETRAYDVSLDTSASVAVSLSTTYRAFWFRVNNQFPTANDTTFYRVGSGSDCVALCMDTDGTIKIRNLGTVS